MSSKKPYNDPDDPLYYAPPWLNERNTGRYPLTPANGNGREDPAAPAQRRPDQQRPAQRRPDQRGLNQGSPNPRRGKASQAQPAPPDIFAEAVARAMEQEFEPEFVEVPASLREDRSLGFAAKATFAVGAAALIALAYVVYFSASDDNADSVLAALPTWQSLTSSMFPAPERKAAPTLVVEDSNGPVNEPLLLGVTVDAPGPGASVTIDRMPAGSRLTAGKRMSASEWRVPAEMIAETSIIPPADFAGEMNLSATLRASDGAALVSSFVRLTWGATAPPDDVVAANDGLIEPSVVLPTESQRQQTTAAQAMASFAAPTQSASSPSQATEEPAAELPPSEIAYFVKRAQELMASGDLHAARLLLIRAARAHDARAALLLAKSYDPSGSRQSGGSDPGRDPEQARNWYQKAKEWGSQEAQRQTDGRPSYR